MARRPMSSPPTARLAGCATHLPPARTSAGGWARSPGFGTGVRRRLARVPGDRRRRRPLGPRRARAGGPARRHDLVRPQNYFEPLPWHARWDTARTLLNRGLGRDYPGTLGRAPLAPAGDGRLRRRRPLREPGADPDRPRRRRQRRLAARPLRCPASRPRPRTSGASGPARPTTTSPCPRGWRSGSRRLPLLGLCAAGAGGAATRRRPRPRSWSPSAAAGAPAGRRSSPPPPRCWLRSGCSSAASAPGSRSPAPALRRRPLRRLGDPARRPLRAAAAAVSPRRAI